MNQFPKTQDLILNYKNGWLDILLNNAANKNALKDSLVKELFIVFEAAKDNKDVRGKDLQVYRCTVCHGH